MSYFSEDLNLYLRPFLFVFIPITLCIAMYVISKYKETHKKEWEYSVQYWNSDKDIVKKGVISISSKKIIVKNKTKVEIEFQTKDIISTQAIKSGKKFFYLAGIVVLCAFGWFLFKTGVDSLSITMGLCLFIPYIFIYFYYYPRFSVSYIRINYRHNNETSHLYLKQTDLGADISAATSSSPSTSGEYGGTHRLYESIKKAMKEKI